MFPFLRGKLSSNVMVNDLEIERMLKRNRCVCVCSLKSSVNILEKKSEDCVTNKPINIVKIIMD